MTPGRESLSLSVSPGPQSSDLEAFAAVMAAFLL